MRCRRQASGQNGFMAKSQSEQDERNSKNTSVSGWGKKVKKPNRKKKKAEQTKGNKPKHVTFG